MIGDFLTPPPTEDVQLAALRVAFPDFGFTVISVGGKRFFEAVRARGGGSLYSVTTTLGSAELLPPSDRKIGG